MTFELTREFLRELFIHDPLTGWLIRRIDWWSAKAGDIAGSIDGRGYLKTRIHGKKFSNHRLIFMYHAGYMPDCEIDHINGDKADNRIENLRACTRSENMINKPKHPLNKSGYKGVHFSKSNNRWAAEICVNKKKKHIGYFDSKEDAAKAYNSAAKERYGEFAFLNTIREAAEKEGE